MSFRRDFVSNLPPNPDDALITLADRASDWLAQPAESGDEINAPYIEQILERFVSRYRPEIRDMMDLDAPRDIKAYVAAIVRYSGVREVDRLLDDYEKVVADAESFGIASLNSAEKHSLHEHLENVRKIIQSSPLPTRKKNALFHRLEALRAEVDSIGTRTDRFFALAGDVAFVLGDMAEKAKPLIDEVKDILKIIRGSRARTENVELPREETIGLPSPDDVGKEDTKNAD